MLNATTSRVVCFRQFGQAAGKSLFSLCSKSTAIISVILIITANNFCRKQRIRQCGLTNIIGLCKRVLSKKLATEKLLLCSLTLCCGGICGTVLSRLSYLTCAKMLHVNHNLDLCCSQTAFSMSGCITMCCFMFLMCESVFWLCRKHPIELDCEQNAGEREPKTKWLTCMFSMSSLAAG